MLALWFEVSLFEQSMAILSHPNPLGRKVMSLRDSNLFLCSRKENTNQILEEKDCGRNRNRDTARNWYSVMPRRYSLGGCLQGEATRCQHVPYEIPDLRKTWFKRVASREVGSPPPTFAACERVQWPCARGHRAPMSRRSEHLFGLGDGAGDGHGCCKNKRKENLIDNR